MPLFATLALGASLFAGPISVSPFAPSTRIVGRFDSTASGAILSWPGTGLQVAFEGKACQMRVGSTGAVLGMVVDGVPTGNLDLVAPIADTLVTLAQYLKPGRHVVEFTKKTEAMVGSLTVKEILLEGIPSTLPQAARRRIEFLGNSITCGYGVLDSVKEHHFSPYSEDFTASFAALSARALGAEVQVVAYSGKGLSRNYGGGTDSTVPQLFSLAGFPPRSKPWNPSRWKPDAVVIDLGTNDFSQAPLPDSAHWEATWMDFLETIRKAHGDIPLVLVNGPMLSDNWPLDAKGKALPALSRVRQHLRNVALRAKTKGFASVSVVDLTPSSSERGYGAVWHPSRSQQSLNASELTRHLRALLGW